MKRKCQYTLVREQQLTSLNQSDASFQSHNPQHRDSNLLCDKAADYHLPFKAAKQTRKNSHRG